MSGIVHHNIQPRDRPTVPPGRRKNRGLMILLNITTTALYIATAGHHDLFTVLRGLYPTSSIVAAITLPSCNSAVMESADSGLPAGCSYHAQREPSEYNP